MNENRLTGCAPEPLMSYLKALGAFRLIAEQGDRSARLSWNGGCAVLMSELTGADLSAFFLERYRPSPILAPWNGGSGFYGGGSEPLEAIAKAKSPRFAAYREAIKAIKRLIPTSKPKDEDKKTLLIKCRAELPDDVVPWLDVCFALGEDKVSFFPLLGTGGNDGRLDFTNNFMQRLAEVLPLNSGTSTEESAELLAASLLANELVPLGRAAVGQFNPGGIGGANGVQGRFEADSRVNPWDYILMIEGTLLFAGSVARRLGIGGSTRAVFPFSVDSVAVGYGSAAATEETTDGSRAELWLPLWEHGAALAEVRQLFAEGRAQIGKQQAKNAVEFSLAVSLLGVSRGIASFSRYGFLKRNGLAFLAAPLGRVAVRARPKARLMADPTFVYWLDQLRRACSDKERTPARYQAALREIERAIFEFSNQSEQGDAAERRALANVLVAVGNAERTLANGQTFCADKYLRPLAGLDGRWATEADEGSVEFSLACALASTAGVRDSEVGPLRAYMEPVRLSGASVEWDAGSTSAVWSRQPLSENLIAVFKRRRLEAFRSGFEGVPLKASRTASLLSVLTFLAADTDDERLESLIWALTAVDWANATRPSPAAGAVDSELPPLEYSVLRLLVQQLPLRARDGLWTLDHDATLSVADPTVLEGLRRQNSVAVWDAISRAARCLKSQGLLVVGCRNRQQPGGGMEVYSDIPPERLFASMLFPLSDDDLARLANAVLYPPETEE
jgi:CRISPR-associated protein Csx17